MKLLKINSFFYFLILLSFQTCTADKVNPLSKLVITSNKAVCKKDKNTKNLFVFTYLDNVLLTLADGSTIKSDELEIQIDTSKIKSKSDDKAAPTQKAENTSKQNQDLSQFKKITFNKNFLLKSANRAIQADKAELFLESKTCELFNNIKIEQTKIKPKDLPITTQCSYAKLNLQTDQIIFQGQELAPVCTTINLEGQKNLLKKPKTKKERRAERKALKEKPIAPVKNEQN